MNCFAFKSPHRLLCLAACLLMGHAARSPAEASSRGAQVCFADIIDRQYNRAPAYQYVGSEMRRVLFAPRTSTPLIYPVREDGTIEVAPDELSPLFNENARGVRLALQFYDGPVSLFSHKRITFQFIPSEGFDNSTPVVARPAGAPMASARVYARQVLPQNMTFTMPGIVVPERGRLDFAIALEQDWRISRQSSVVFRIRATHNESSQTLFESVVHHHESMEAPGWREESVDLSAYAGQSLHLSFESEGLAQEGDARFAFPLWANPVLYAEDAEVTRQQPRIILIALDTLRADRLGCYGYERNTSPNMDRFAQDAVLFEQAIAASSWTTPSFASIFTGKPPMEHEAGVFSKGFALPARFTTLAELARKAGMLTAAFTEGVAVRSQFGFAKGFDRYHDGDTPGIHETGTAERTFRRANAWVERYGHLPYFLFVHTYEPHDPYNAPDPYKLKFADPAYQGDVGGVPGKARTAEDKRHISDRYDGCIAYTDHWVGWFLDQLDARGLAEDTTVIILSDHGEEFWEHHGVGHVSHLYDEVLRVPLIMRLPGSDNAPKRIQEQVALTDVFATVLDLLNQPVPDALDSYSLLPLINEGRWPRTDVVSELHYFNFEVPTEDGQPLEWIKRSIRQPALKYIKSTKEWAYKHITEPDTPFVFAEELFDLREDPAEQHNMKEERPEEKEQLRQTLQQFIEDLAINGEDKDEQKHAVGHEDIEALQALGYL